jgi:hypothetical protein
MSGGAAWLPVVARIAMPLGQSTVYSYATPRPRNVTEPASLRKKGASQSLADATLDERKPQTRAAEVPRCILSDAASNCGESRAEIDSLSRAPSLAEPGPEARHLPGLFSLEATRQVPARHRRRRSATSGLTWVRLSYRKPAAAQRGWRLAHFHAPRQSLYTRSVERGASVRPSIGFRGPY